MGTKSFCIVFMILDFLYHLVFYYILTRKHRASFDLYFPYIGKNVSHYNDVAITFQ